MTELEQMRAQLDQAIDLARRAPALPAHELVETVEKASLLLRTFMTMAGDLRRREATLAGADMAMLSALMQDASAAAPLFRRAAEAAEKAADKQ